MRANLEQIARIEQFLLGQMSPIEKQKFEQELAEQPELQEQVKQQQFIQETALRLSMKQIMGKVALEQGVLPTKTSLIRKWGWPLSIGLSIVLVFLGVQSLISNMDTSPNSENAEGLPSSIVSTYWMDTVHYSEEELKDTPCELASLVPIHEEEHRINNAENNVFEGEKGSLIFVPKDAFETMDGKALKNTQVTIGLVEALDVATMIQYGLTTLSGKDILRSGGMVRISAYQDGKEIKLKSGKAFEIQIPTEEYDPEMMAWKGVPQPNGTVNWEQPQNLENYLNKVPLKDLDFLPAGFNELVAEGLPFRQYKTASKQNVEDIYFQLERQAVPPLPEVSRNEGTSDTRSKTLIKNSTNKAQMYTAKLKFKTPIDLNTILVAVTRNDLTRDNVNFVKLKNDGTFSFFAPLNPKLFSLSVSTNCDVIQVNTDQMSISKTNQLLVENEPCGRLNKSQKEMADSISDISIAALSKSWTNCYIDPLKIKTLLTSRFENTFIATREFEERLQFLHDQKEGAKLLEVYLQNLHKNMWESDEKIARLTQGSVQEKFQKWAQQKCTNVRNASVSQKEIETYLHQQHALFLKEKNQLLRELRSKDVRKLQAIQNDLDKLREKRNNQARAERNYLNQGASSTWNNSFNSSAYSRVAARPSYKVSWFSTGWMNIDAYLKRLASEGERKLSIKIKGNHPLARVFQSLPSLATIIPLNRL